MHVEIVFFEKIFFLIEILVSFTIMKLFSHKNFSILCLLLMGLTIYGQDLPPPDGPLPPPGFPIDEGVFILLGISILFGLYKLYQYKQHKKMPA